jgi:hypothetical protein
LRPTIDNPYGIAEIQTPEQKRMKGVVAQLTHFMAAYSHRKGYESYSDKKFIDDVIQGLGLALNSEEYRTAQGYDKFKKLLLEHLNERT